MWTTGGQKIVPVMMAVASRVVRKIWGLSGQMLFFDSYDALGRL